MLFLKYLRVWFAVLVLIILPLTQMEAETKKTTMEEALACGSRALAEAKQSSSPEALIIKYLHVDSLTARALQVQHVARWYELTLNEQELYRQVTNTYVAKHNKFETVILDSVVFKPERGRAIGSSYELPGMFKDTNGTLNSFSLLLVVDRDHCVVIDGRWNDAWISRYISF